MYKNNPVYRYHIIEDYFFTAVSKAYRHFSTAVSAYFTGVHAGSLNPIIIKQPAILNNTAFKQAITFLEK